MLYALYKCSDVREIQKGKSMKRKKSTQLLAVALTAAMLAQPVGAQMVFAEGNADAAGAGSKPGGRDNESSS